MDPDTAVNGLEMMAAELRDCSREEKRILKHALEELIADEKMGKIARRRSISTRIPGATSVWWTSRARGTIVSKEIERE